MLKRLPLTAGGWTVLVLGALAYVGGWQLGWNELMIIAAGCLVVLIAAIPFVVGRLALDVERSLQPDQVIAGEPSVAVLRIGNPRRTPIAGRSIEDHTNNRRVRIAVPALAPGGSTEAVYPLPTSRRGVVTVGPAVIVKADLLGLMRREVEQTGMQTLWVHPRHTLLRPLPVGYAKDLEGPTSDASPAGDIAFHALREYQLGDDHRHVHWLSTARTGSLMVRHYVDNRRPNLTIVVDDDRASYDGDAGFETAIEIAASLAITAMHAGQTVALWVGDGAVASKIRPATSEDLLNRLTTVECHDHGDGTGQSVGDTTLRALRVERGTSAAVVVTGGIESERLLAMTTTARRSTHVVVVRVWTDGELHVGSLPGARLIDVDTLQTFAAAWGQLCR